MPSSRNRVWLVILGAGALLWAALAWGVVPRLIESAYRQESFAFLNRILEHRASHPVDYYLSKWSWLALGLLGLWLGGGALALTLTSRWFRDRIVGTATPQALGAVRILICLLLAWYAWHNRAQWVQDLPRSQRVPMGIMDFLLDDLGLDALRRDPMAIQIFTLATTAVLLLGAAGAFTRFVLPLGALLYLPLVGISRAFTSFNHTGIVPWYCIVVLCFTRAGDGWSLDALGRARRGRSLPESLDLATHYAWARYAVWTAIAASYVMAGLCKLRNGTLWWWHGSNMQSMLYTEALRPGVPGSDFILHMDWLPQWFFTLMGILTVLTEAGFGVVLVSRRARLILPPLAALMHLGIIKLMKIPFWDMVWLQLAFYDWPAIWARIRGRLRARRPDAAAVPATIADGGLPAPSAAARPRRLEPLALAALILALSASWAVEVEYYPVTSMQMFSNQYDESGIVTYHRIYMSDASGVKWIAPLEKMGFGSTRYQVTLKRAFHDDRGRRTCIDVLRDLARRWNGRVDPSRRIEYFEVEEREWDFAHERSHPQYGRRVDAFVIDVRGGGAETSAEGG